MSDVARLPYPEEERFYARLGRLCGGFAFASQPGKNPTPVAFFPQRYNDELRRWETFRWELGWVAA